MITPEQIAFSVEIKKIKEKGPLFGFTLFQAFAIWLRKYIDPWVLLHKSSQEIKTYTNTYQGIVEQAELLDTTLQTAASDNEKQQEINTYKNTYQGMAEQAELLDTRLQAAASDNKKQMEAYLEFIDAMIIDRHLYTPIQNPIFFFGHDRGVNAGIYDKTLTLTSHSDITFRPYGEDKENPGKYIGNYIELNDLLKPALHCFYREITTIKLDKNPINAIIETWNKEHFEQKKADANHPSTDRIENTILFLMPFMGLAGLGAIFSLVCLGVAMSSKEIQETINDLPGGPIFPMWVGIVLGVVVGLTQICHHAWIKRGPHHDRDDEIPPYTNIFIVAPIISAFWCSLVGLIVAIEQDNFMILANTAWISAVVGVGIGLIYELDRFKQYSSHPTQRPETVQAPGSPHQSIEMYPIAQYLRDNPPRS